jgi:hypothetical protein
MYTLYAEVVSRNQPERNESEDIIENDIVESLYQLAEEIPEEVRVYSVYFFCVCQSCVAVSVSVSISAHSISYSVFRAVLLLATLPYSKPAI